jgi:ABC-type polysaccharide/polyol phosphate transport system ATPase subunit
MKNINNNIAIKLTNVSKLYTIHHEKPTLIEKFYHGREEKFWALKNINLTIEKGERIGIIGPNGSGKTTLLKMFSRITTPTIGSILSNGKIVSLIDLEAGFHPDLTGYQNIYLNSLLLGVSKKEIDKKLQCIIDFADIKQFIDTPLFTYSQGMKLRLGFSIAIHSNPDIMILDEGFAAGDDAFQHKSQETLHKYSRSGKTLIIVSHWLDQIKIHATRVIWIEKGNIIKDGGTTVLSKYLQNEQTIKK